MEHLKTEIERLAAIGMTMDEIITIIDDSAIMEIFRNKNSVLYVAYKKGRLKLKAELLTSLKNLALNGSTPALERMIKLTEIQTNSE